MSCGSFRKGKFYFERTKKYERGLQERSFNGDIEKRNELKNPMFLNKDSLKFFDCFEFRALSFSS